MLSKKRFTVLLKHLFGGYIRESFSQQKQDRWIGDVVFPGIDGGFFVEVGAHDGITISNTYYLEKFKGWNGILVEPNPTLCEEVRCIRNVGLEECAVTDKSGMTRFIPDGAVGSVGTGEDDDRSIEVRAKTLREVLRDNSAPEIIHYLSVDVEGHEDKVFHEFPVRGYEFLSITVEAPSRELRKKIRKSGYTKILEIPNIDCIYVKDQVKKQLEDNFTRKNWSYLEFKVNGLIERIST